MKTSYKSEIKMTSNILIARKNYISIRKNPKEGIKANIKNEKDKPLVVIPEKRRPLRARENVMQSNILNNKIKHGLKVQSKDNVQTKKNAEDNDQTKNYIEDNVIKENIKKPSDSQPKVIDKIQSPLKAFSSLSLKEVLYDVDSQDFKDELCVPTYAKDIHEYMFIIEQTQALKDDYIASPYITLSMRQILIDWIMQIHQHFKLLPETLYLTVSIIDRYLQSVKDVQRKNLQLVGVTSMFIACKFEELYIMEVRDFVYVTKDTYSIQEILSMEIAILKIIDFAFSKPYSIHFLRRYSKIAQVSFEEHTMSKFFIEMTLLDPSILSQRPSIIAASALCLAMKICKGINSQTADNESESDDEKDICWVYIPFFPRLNDFEKNKGLQHHSHYAEKDLNALMVHYLKLSQKNFKSAHYKTLISKYSTSKFSNVASMVQDYCDL